MTGRVPAWTRRKPDPSDPWRYVCPECGGQVVGKDRTSRYRCCTCGEYHARDDLADRRD